jgi:DNA-binding NarL/FixJ family response regulator
VNRFAAEASAAGLAGRAAALARRFRLELDPPVTPAVEDRERLPPPFAGLTTRELEVLGRLVVARTYSEIASTLYVSEKTVSSHVSHLLRKTDTHSRRELSELAERLGFPEGGAGAPQPP